MRHGHRGAAVPLRHHLARPRRQHVARRRALVQRRQRRLHRRRQSLSGFASSVARGRQEAAAGWRGGRRTASRGSSSSSSGARDDRQPGLAARTPERRVGERRPATERLAGLQRARGEAQQYHLQQITGPLDRSIEGRDSTTSAAHRRVVVCAEPHSVVNQPLRRLHRGEPVLRQPAPDPQHRVGVPDLVPHSVAGQNQELAASTGRVGGLL